MRAKNHSKQPFSPTERLPTESDFWQRVFAGCLGGFLGLSLLKFGNPVILDRMVEPPTNIWEYLLQPWPVAWGYWLLAGLIILSFSVMRLSSETPRWIIVLPLVWLGWQGVAAIKTVDVHLTRVTIIHFATCVVFFYFGLFGLSRVRRPGPFWLGLLLGFGVVLWTGFEQHYGGLEATRQFVYSQPGWQQYPPEYLRKIASSRIFSTLVYPNALAGGVILWLPSVVAATWKFADRLPAISRSVLVALLAYGGLACLYWSGSKAGWLIALLMAMVVLGQRPMPRKLKMLALMTICLIGLTGFFIKYSTYFQKGATSVGARFDYWRAAWEITKANPLLGTGPGTFSVSYRKIKPPEAEMARLVHNDFLEQASDSGIVGFLSYSAFVFGTVVFLYRRRKTDQTKLFFPIWLGLFGWALQGFVEFSLYIPALAWSALTVLGLLCGSSRERIEIDTDRAVE